MQEPIRESRRALAVALDAAIDAGQYFRSRIDSVAEVKTKSSPSDLVTDVDPECERRIRKKIFDVFPHHHVLGEESTAPGAVASAAAAAAAVAAEHLWIVDPLDGTTNFVQGIPLSVVSIAYAVDGQLTVGVIYDPYRDEVFFGVRGEGAYTGTADAMKTFLTDPGLPMPGRRLKASETRDMRRSVVATGLPTRGQEREWTTKAGLRLMGHVKSFRLLGAAALHLAYVASGRIDVFWEYELNAWDLAAGCLLVTEAGGVVSAIGGGEYHLQVRNIIAAGQKELARDINEAIQVPVTDGEGTLH